MAKLVPCKSCGAQISTGAKVCPQCGHPVRRTRAIVWIIGGVIVFAGLARIAAEKPATTLTPVDAPTSKPAPKVLSEAEKRTTRAAVGAAALRQASKDPESFEMKSVTMHPDNAICYNFRAKNSFNAMLAGSAIYTPRDKLLIEEHDGNGFVSAWNKSCTKADGTDVTETVGIINRLAR